MAIEPETSTERKKLADVLDMMKRQDPTFRARESEETGQTLISGMGELHLEVIKHRLLRDYKLNVRVHKPRVSYRETIEQRRRGDRRVPPRRSAARRCSAEVRHPHGAVRRGHRAGDRGGRGGTDELPEPFLARRHGSRSTSTARAAACSASR